MRLVREPDNPHDRNAVAVYAAWRWKNGKQGQGKLGHLPADVAAFLARTRPSGELHAAPVKYFRAVAGSDDYDERTAGARLRVGWSAHPIAMQESPRQAQPASAPRRRRSRKPGGCSTVLATALALVAIVVAVVMRFSS